MPTTSSFLEIPVPDVQAGRWAVVAGRNGYFDITAIRLVQRETSAGKVVDILPVGKRGRVIQGGFWHIPEHIMDELCQRWLEEKEAK